MSTYHTFSTGNPGIDKMVDGLRLGDNVVWQVDSVASYAKHVTCFVDQALAEGREVIYFRFASHPPLLKADDEGGSAGSAAPSVRTVTVDPASGFEAFTRSVYQEISRAGVGVFYVFDLLTELLQAWGSDLMVMNFFKVTCPHLYDLDTVAYFGLLRGEHSFDAIAGIRETTQLLLDLHVLGGQEYLQTHKAWGRYSPTMFFPHLLRDSSATPVTSSAQAADLFGKIGQHEPPLDPWRALLQQAHQAASSQDRARREEVAGRLRDLLIGGAGRMEDLAAKHLSLEDLLLIAERRIGSGRIGGKTVGMLVATKIVEEQPTLQARLEPQDSFFLGSDLFFTYLIDNGWWADWVRQKDADSYFELGAQLHESLRHGQFGPAIRERFLRLLEYFGQSPVIVRSSSLLEDNFGNAFSGKYDSVFLANQGSPEDRLRAFEDAVRVVYASVMGPEALHYRLRRNLGDSDEQMAVLVQRVSGAHHDQYFFPNAAGVGNSHNLYVFAPDIDPDAGALRLVVGLGTRAVDRKDNDYAKLVPLDKPLRSAVEPEDLVRFSQRRADVLDLARNELVEVPLTSLEQFPAHWDLFLSRDFATERRLKELGRRASSPRRVCDFEGLLHTDFPGYVRELLDVLEREYHNPVDVEFTVNTDEGGGFRFGLVQCRPLQTKGVGTAVAVPQVPPSSCLISADGGFMGGNLELVVDRVVYVDPAQYLGLGEQDRYEVARVIGRINQEIGQRKVLAIGPGRWGSRITSLGVPTHFAELNNMAALVEFTDPALEFNVDLSFGSHFFQDLVETGIFFVALDQSRAGNVLNAEQLMGLPNLADTRLASAIRYVETPGLTLYADVLSQRLCGVWA